MKCPCYIAGWADCEKAHKDKLSKDIENLRQETKEYFERQIENAEKALKEIRRPDDIDKKV